MTGSGGLSPKLGANPSPALLRSKPLLAATVASVVALVGLVAWQLSPARALLGHGPAPGRSHLALLGWFTLSWLLMTVATMLPTSLPLLAAFGRLLGDRPDAGRRIADMVLGYLALWTAAGLVLAGVDVGIHTVVERTSVAGYAGLILPATLALAGAYQLSGTSARCLRACRTPFSFLARRWSGRRPALDALRVGLDYGVSCLGCCAALMMIMFAVGMASPLTMIGLGGVAALHKYARWGPALAKITGVALLLAAIAIGVGQIPMAPHAGGH